MTPNHLSECNTRGTRHGLKNQKKRTNFPADQVIPNYKYVVHLVRSTCMIHATVANGPHNDDVYSKCRDHVLAIIANYAEY